VLSDEFDDLSQAVDRRKDENAAEAASARTLIAAPRLVSRLYAAANQPLRAKLIACLVRPLGPLGLVAVAAGAFAGLLRHGSNGGSTLVIDDVARYSKEQVYELARFVEQVSPQALQQVATLAADSPVGIAAFSVSAAVLLLRVMQGART
jgi:hypothetical protein